MLEVGDGAGVQTDYAEMVLAALMAALANLGLAPALLVDFLLESARPRFLAPITAIVGTEKVEGLR